MKAPETAPKISHQYGDLAQPVEHLVRNEGVAGPSPAVSTREMLVRIQPGAEHLHTVVSTRWTVLEKSLPLLDKLQET